MKIAVLGAGAWGTAVAAHLARRHDVVLWARDAQLVDRLAATGINDRYLPACPLPSALRFSADLHDAVAHGTPDAAAASLPSLLILATPVAGLRPMLAHLTGRDAQGAALLPPGSTLAWLCKGFEAGSGQLPHQVASEVLDAAYPPGSAAGIADARPICGVLTGPSFAKEVALGLPVALTAASVDPVGGQRIRDACHHDAMRIYTSDDLVGVEVGGAVKNVMAIATGIADGLGLGLNARAALVTRGLAEMTRLGIALGARAETFTGLSGVGDLILTATGDLSRNRKVGMQLAGGQSLESILSALGHVAEGVACARAVDALAQARSVDMPITRAVCGVLFDGQSPRDAVAMLLQRDAKAE
jgi:glycerol-3-phosphate dehydrogenase (NAD(P)+)